MHSELPSDRLQNSIEQVGHAGKSKWYMAYVACISLPSSRKWAIALLQEKNWFYCSVMSLRGLLLRHGTFPLSRPELAAQVRQIGYSELAVLHERLRNVDLPSNTDIALGLRYSKKLLIHLDRKTYGRIALDHAKVIRGKEVKRAQLRAERNPHSPDSST
jgi:hypothetical protein